MVQYYAEITNFDRLVGMMLRNLKKEIYGKIPFLWSAVNREPTSICQVDLL